MVYKTFLSQIAASIQKILGDGCQVHLVQIQKNNGRILDGLAIREPDVSFSPAIYLEPYYKEYQKGIPFESVCFAVLDAYKKHSQPCLPESLDLSNFPSLKDRIVFRLINRASNQALLEEIPSVPFLDLSIVFCFCFSPEPDGQMTALIRRSHLNLWNLSSEDLFQLAMANTPRLLPSAVRSLTSVMRELREDFGDDPCPSAFSSDASDPEDLYETPLYVLTNHTGIHGAACLLYPQPLKNFADSQKADVIILPSSIHEVLLTADRPGMDYNALSRMVMEINCSDVPLEDRLSNQVYRYSRKSGSLSVLSHSPESVGTPNP